MISQVNEIDDDKPEEIVNKENPEIRLLKELHEQIINTPKRRKRKRRDEGNNLKIEDSINPNILEKLEKSKEVVMVQPLQEDLKAIGIVPKNVYKSRSKKMLVFSAVTLRYNIHKFAEIILK